MLVVGDAIVDEYVYVQPIGKSIKEDVISVLYDETESFDGGVSAGANHLRDFCRTVDVMYGDSVMINRRFVDKNNMRKLFTVHEKRSCFPKSADIGDYDVVIVTDFGHGFITSKLIDRLSTEAQFLAVNAQTNSTNIGFNLVTKFPRAELVVVDQLEARLAVHDRISPIDKVILKLGFRHVIVTMGDHGAIGYDGQFHTAEAKADAVVDTMGAGDAFLCVTAPFSRAGVSMPDLLRIGNAAGAVKVRSVGNRSPVTRAALEKYL